MTHISYPSKILLFGEYSVLLGSKALSVPNPQYFGTLELFDIYHSKVGIKIEESNSILKQLLDYIKENSRDSSLAEILNLSKFEKDIKSGLFFRSNIPEGSGLGSSGALVAAVYQEYVLNSDVFAHGNFIDTRKNLAFIESYFHQNSSGVDPLVSLLNKPLMIEENNISIVEEYEMLNNRSIFELVDSKSNRYTAGLVEKFKQKLHEKTFENAVYETLIPTNNKCVEAYLNGDRDTLYEQMYILSEFQLQYMEWLIPSAMQQLWKEGLESGNFYKLCGAGGGGFFLRYLG